MRLLWCVSMKTLISTALTVVGIVGIVLGIIGLTLQAVHADYNYGFQRLQLQGQLQDVAEWATLRVRAICDTGNGTMLYVAMGTNQMTTMVIQPSGCAQVKIRAEK